MRLTRIAAAKPRRSAADRTARPPNPRPSRLIDYAGLAEKIPLGAGGLLTPLEGKTPAGFAAIAIGLCLTLCLREPSTKATAATTTGKGNGFHRLPAPVSGRAVEHTNKIGP